MSVNIILICVVLLIIQHSVASLNCYFCVGGTDGCGSKFNSKGSGVVQLEASANLVCMKSVHSTNPDNIDRWAYIAPCTTYITPGSSLSDETTSYCCDTDLCNGAQIKSASITIGLALVALVLFYCK
ncbi:unnamed protein product [Adineta ricciae]|uniref:Uncharacterized protein n=1 Tax=Adineta ricciae TaxID=249248 RepID=A0A815TRF0_ADIRI|nr:unnamed protein product [Adineta ricciae]